MKRLLPLFFIVCIVAYSNGYAQFDKTSFNVSVGLTVPSADLKGSTPFNYNNNWTGYWLNYNYTPPRVDSTVLYNILMTDSSFIKDNYGASTGFSISGSVKTNFDKFNTFRGILTLAYSGFNSFQTDKTGNTPLLVNNQGFSVLPVAYSNSFSNLGIGFGLEVAPTSFTNIFTPYFGATFNLNFMSASLTRAYGRDSIKADFGTEFRLGVAFHGGFEMKVSKGIDIVAGARYDLGNLILKTTRSSYSDALQYGKTNLSLNDAEGFYYSNLASVEGVGVKQYNTKDKNINWWTFFIGVNIYPSALAPTPKK